MQLSNVVENSQFGIECDFYTGSKIVGSELGHHCIVGDFSRLTNSFLSNYVKIDRSNFILCSTIHDYSYTGSSTVIMHSTIGKFCSISWGVTIGPGEHDYSRISAHDFLYNPRYGIMPDEVAPPYDRYALSCDIGNDVWIGANVTVLRGVKIGNGAVVGANSVVTRDIPPYAIACGNPARIIKYRFPEHIISELQSLGWWDLPHETIKAAYDIFSTADISIALKKLQVLCESNR